VPRAGTRFLDCLMGLSMKNAASISVSIEYDDSLLAAGIAATLESVGGFQVVKSRSDTTNSTLGSWQDADIVVADYETGLKLARMARRRTAILILTRNTNESHIRLAIEQGVSGYLLVGCTPDELVSGLRAVSRGGKVLSTPVAAKLADSVRHPPLTPRELTVLSHLVKGLSDKAIGNQLAVSAGTVKSHVKSILNKLGARGRTEAAAIARHRGLFFEDADWRGERAA
jgi:DNA-binding NarL/FixJ family response regulator